MRTSGVWIVKSGEEEAFVEEWTELVTWASGFAGSGTLRLVRESMCSYSLSEGPGSIIPPATVATSPLETSHDRSGEAGAGFFGDAPCRGGDRLDFVGL